MKFPIGIGLRGVGIKRTCIADVNNTISSLENIALVRVHTTHSGTVVAFITHTITISVSLIGVGIVRTAITRWTVCLLVDNSTDSSESLQIPCSLSDGEFPPKSPPPSLFPGSKTHYELLHSQNPSISAPRFSCLSE